MIVTLFNFLWLTEGDRTGYRYFPAVPYPDRLELIELREDGLEEGFKMKEEYRYVNVTTYGKVEK